MKNLFFILFLITNVSHADNTDNAITSVITSIISEALNYGSTNHKFDVGNIQNSAVLGVGGILLDPIVKRQQENQQWEAEEDRAYRDWADRQDRINRVSRLDEWSRRYRNEHNDVRVRSFDYGY